VLQSIDQLDLIGLIQAVCILKIKSQNFDCQIFGDL